MTDICIHKNEKYSVSWAMVSEHNVWLASGFQPIVDLASMKQLSPVIVRLPIHLSLQQTIHIFLTISVDPAGSAP